MSERRCAAPDCGKLLVKRPKEAWAEFARRRWCDKECRNAILSNEANHCACGARIKPAAAMCGACRHKVQASALREEYERIRPLLAEGLSYAEIVRRTGLHKDRVRRLATCMKPDGSLHPKERRDLGVTGEGAGFLDKPPARLLVKLADLPECERRFVVPELRRYIGWEAA